RFGMGEQPQNSERALPARECTEFHNRRPSVGRGFCQVKDRHKNRRRQSPVPSIPRLAFVNSPTARNTMRRWPESSAALDATVRSGSVGPMNLGSPRINRWFAGWFYFGPANLRVEL